MNKNLVWNRSFTFVLALFLPIASLLSQSCFDSSANANRVPVMIEVIKESAYPMSDAELDDILDQLDESTFVMDEDAAPIDMSSDNGVHTAIIIGTVKSAKHIDKLKSQHGDILYKVWEVGKAGPF